MYKSEGVVSDQFDRPPLYPQIQEAYWLLLDADLSTQECGMLSRYYSGLYTLSV